MKKFTRALLGCALVGSLLSANAATFVGDRSDFRDETIYFAMTTRFYDGDPKNNVCTWDKQDQQISSKDPAWRGDFKGLIEKLDYIKALGFTAIWITPIVQNGSGIDYHGYHAMDLSSVDLRYESRTSWGSEEDVDFQDLIDAAHAKGMKIVLDVVLQHTGNFGEVNLNPLFTRDQNIRNQANIEACMIPDSERLGGASYWNLDPNTEQYPARFKYFKNPQYDTNNYYHHYGTGWNWDLPNRWWGQIAGDCVDLNTENDAVAEYVVECYGKFIEMGVDAFRIDTSGHISPLTFNTQFIPQFHEIANRPEVKAKRLNGIDFFMFGEVCQRFQGSVVYRDQPNLSSYFYTWKSSDALISEFNSKSSLDWWKTQTLPEGHDSPVGPMATCESDTQDKSRSNNAWMQNGAYHEPDYSQASGFNVIDFPVHYSFNSVSSVMGLFSQDNYYNDATFNVVYVDSHDYSPGPNDGIRFNGGTAQWAENLSWMFTFRGIPCLYYGSEVEFMKGAKIDDGMQTKLNQTGRAYFGHYLEGDVTTTDFAQYSASGQVAQTLNGDLAHHIQQLNKIRAAVPALRKGQYTFDDCSASGGWAFKRAYKDSYALVAVNGGATFSNVPAGTYTDIVTGQTYTGGGSITVSAPSNQGQLRVLVKDWTGGKVVEDGKFIYTTSSVSKGGSPSASDPGTDSFYTYDDAVGTASVLFSPAGGAFKTDTQTVTVTLSETATSGWFKVGDGSQVSLMPGVSQQFTIGADMSFGETVTVSWSASDEASTYNGTVTYKKVDPNATITVYVKASAAPNLYAWETYGGTTTEFNGAWPGTKLSSTTVVDGNTYYYMTFPDVQESLSIIFNDGGSNQTSDITGITADVYYEYDGGSTATEVFPTIGPSKPSITANPASGKTFTESLSVTLSVSGADAVYYTLDGTKASASSTLYTGAITLTETTTINAFATNDQGDTTASFTYTKVDEIVSDEFVVYWDNSSTGWSTPYCHYWGASESTWPGVAMTKFDGNIWKCVVPDGTTGLVFNGNPSPQTGDFTAVNGHVYTMSGDQGDINDYLGGGSDDDDTTTSSYWVLFDNSLSNWAVPYVWAWDSSNGDACCCANGSWPGDAMTLRSDGLWIWTLPTGKSVPTHIIFSNNGNPQTSNLTFNNGYTYKSDGSSGVNGVEVVEVTDVHYYNLQGVEVLEPTPGIYIVRRGNKVTKEIIR